MENVTRTVYSSYIQTNLFLDLASQYFENSTLNEKLGVQSRILPTADQKSRLAAYVIGNRGHKTEAQPMAGGGTRGFEPYETAQHARAVGLGPERPREAGADELLAREAP